MPARFTRLTRQRSWPAQKHSPPYSLHSLYSLGTAFREQGRAKLTIRYVGWFRYLRSYERICVCTCPELARTLLDQEGVRRGIARQDRIITTHKMASRPPQPVVPETRGRKAKVTA